MLKDEAKSNEVLAECRACLQPCPRGERRELFKCWDPPWTGMENTVAEDLVKLTNVQISETDRHSKILCQNCYIILQKANHFVEIVRKSDQVLNQRYLDDDSKPTEDNNWPKPIKVDTNLCLYDNVEIKDECLSDEEFGHVNGDDGQDFSKVDVKIEAEEWHPQQPMLLNGAISFNHVNEELAKINGYTSAEEHNGPTKSLLNEHLRPNNGNGMRYESDEADSNSLETRIKDEPSSDQETESSVASDLSLECLLCSKSFLSISGLKAHVIAQHSYKTVRRKSNDDNTEENQFKYVCKICQRRFETSTDLMVHETCHNKCVCYGCNASFETFDLLTQHRRSCKAVNNKEVGKVLKLEDVQRLANVAQRILEVMTKYTIFCQDSEQGNIDECYQALLAVITQKEDSICDDLSDTDNFCDLSDIDSIDDTLLEYDKHFLSDLDCSATSLNAVIEKTPLNNFDKTDDGFYSMDGTFKIVAKASYPVVKLTRLDSATLDNWSRNIYLNEHSAISLNDSLDSFEEVAYLDSSILEMSDDTLCSSDIYDESAVDESNTISKETLNHRYFKKISDSNGIVVKSDPNNAISEVAINRDLNKPSADMTFNSAINISKLNAEEKAIDRNKLSSGACLSAPFSPNPAADEINIDETGFDEFDDDFHSEDVAVCLDILSKYVTEETADNNASDKIDPNIPINKSNVDTFNLILQERSSRNDAPVNLPINLRCDPIAEICEKTNLDKSDKSYSNDIAPEASIKVIDCVEESTPASKLIEENSSVCNISAVSSVKACKDIDNVTEEKIYDRSNEDFYANKISVCTANMSNFETPVNDCDLDKVNQEFDLFESNSPVSVSHLILEKPFKGFENIHNNPNSNDFFNVCTANMSNFETPVNDCDSDKVNEEFDLSESNSPVSVSNLILEKPFKGFENIHNNPNSNDFFNVCTANMSNFETPVNDCDSDKVNEEFDLSESNSPVSVSNLILEKPFKGFENIHNNPNSNDFFNVCTANMSNFETPVNDCDSDKVNEEFDLSESNSPVSVSNLILEKPFKGFENIHNNPNSNDFFNNAYKKIFEETAETYEKGHNGLYSNNFTICTIKIPSIINPYTDISGRSMDSPRDRIQQKQKINEKSYYNHKKPRIVEKDYTFIFKSTVTRKLIPGCYSYCKYKCSHNITPRQRINMCEKFWKMDLKTQRKFVNNNIHLNNQGYHTFAGKKRRTFINYVYILQISNQCVRVCKKFFEDTLSIVIVPSLRKQIRPDKDPNKRRKNKHLKLDSCKNTHKGHKQYSPIVDSNQLNPYVKLIDIELDKKLLGNTNDTNHSKDVKESNLDAVEHYDNTELGIGTNSYDTASFNSEIVSDLSTNDIYINNTNIDSCTTNSDNRSFIETNSNSFEMESDILQPDIDASKYNNDKNYLDSKTEQLNIVKYLPNIDKNHSDIDHNQPYTDKNQPPNDQLDARNNQLDSDNDHHFWDDVKHDTNNSKLDSESNHFIIDNYPKYSDTELDTDNNQAINDINYLSSETNLLNNEENQTDTVNSRFDNDNNQIDSETNLLNNDENQRGTVNSRFDNDNNKIDSETNLLNNDENQRGTVNSRFDNDNNQIDSETNLLNNDENQRGTVNSRFDNDNNQIDSETNLLNNDNNQIDSETNPLNNDENKRDTVNSRFDNDNSQIYSETNLLNIDINQPHTDIAITQIDTDHNKLDINKIKFDDKNNHLDIPTNQLDIDKNKFVTKTDQLHDNQSHRNVNSIADEVNKLDICPDFDLCQLSSDSKETINNVIESETDTNHLNTNPEPVSYTSYIDNNIDRMDTDIYQCAEVVHQFFDDTNKPHVGSDTSDTNLYNDQPDGGNNPIEINNHECTINQQEIDTNQSLIKMLTTDTKKPDDVMSNSQCQQIHYQSSDQVIINTNSFDTATDLFETDIIQSTEALINQHITENKQADRNINIIVTDTCRISTNTEVIEIGINESITSTNLLETGMTQSDRNFNQQVTDNKSLSSISKSDIHVYQSDTNQETQFEVYCDQSTTCGSNQLDTNQCVLINNPSITDTSTDNAMIVTATNASKFDIKISNSNYVEHNTYNISNNTSDIFNPDSCANNLEPKNNISTVQSDAYIDQLVTDIYQPVIDSDDRKDSDWSNYFKHHMKENSSNIHESGIHLSDFDIYQSNFNSLIKSKIATQQAKSSSINNYVDTATCVENSKRNQQKIANHKNKLQRIIGKGYKFMFRYKTTRCLMPVCYGCKYKCISHITHEQRQNIFKEFWNMNIEAQTTYLNNNVLLINPFGHPKPEGVRSKLNHSFFLPVNDQRLRVCKKFFVNTLCIYMIDIAKQNCNINALKCRMDPYVKLVDITYDKKLNSYLVPEPSANHSLSLNMNNYQSEDESISFYIKHPDRANILPEVDIFENTSYYFNTQSSNVNTPVETYTFDTPLSHKQSQLSDTYIQPISIDVCQTSIDKCSDSQNQSPKYTQLSNVDSQPIIRNTCLASTETFSSCSDVQSSDRYTNLINVETQRNMDVCHFSVDTCYSNLGEETRGIRVQSSSGEAQSFKAILKDWASTQILNTNTNIESQHLNMNLSSIDSNSPLVNVCTPFNKLIDMQETDLGIQTTAVEISQNNINSYISGIDTQLPKLDDQIQRVYSGETIIKHPSSFHTQSYEIDEQASNINKCPSTIVKDRFSFDTQSCEIDCLVQSVGNSHETIDIYPSSLNNLKCEIDTKNSNGDLRAVESSSFNSQTDFNANPPMTPITIDRQNSSIESSDICKVGIITCNDIQTPDVYKRSSENIFPDFHQARKEALATGFEIQPFKLDYQVQSVDKCLTSTETQHDIDAQSCKSKEVISCLDNDHQILESKLDSQSTNTDYQISINSFQVSTETNPSRIETSHIVNDDANQTNLYNDESSDINQMALNLLENSLNINKSESTYSHQTLIAFNQPNTNQTSILDKFEVDCDTNQVDKEPASNITILDPCESKQLLDAHSIAFGLKPHAVDNLPTIPATIVTHPPCLDNHFSNVDIENVNYVNNQAICLAEPFDSVVSQLHSKQHVQQINNQVQTISTDFCQGIKHSSSSIYTTLSNTNSGDPYVNSHYHMSNVDRQLISKVSNQSVIETYPSFFDTKSSYELIQSAKDDTTNFESAPTDQDQSFNQYALLSNFYSQPTNVECLQTEIETYPLNYDTQTKKYAELSHIESQANEIYCHTSLGEFDSCQASFDTQPHTVNVATPDVVAQSFKSILNDWAS